MATLGSAAHGSLPALRAAPAGKSLNRRDLGGGAGGTPLRIPADIQSELRQTVPAEAVRQIARP